MIGELVAEPIVTTDLPASSTDKTPEALKAKLNRFLAKGFMFRTTGVGDEPEVAERFSYVEFDTKPRGWRQRLNQWLAEKMGTAPQRHAMTELAAVFGRQNQAPKNSLRSYLESDLVLFTRHVDGRCFIRVGSLIGSRFYGVQTIRYDLENDPILR